MLNKFIMQRGRLNVLVVLMGLGVIMVSCDKEDTEVLDQQTENQVLGKRKLELAPGFFSLGQFGCWGPGVCVTLVIDSGSVSLSELVDDELIITYNKKEFNDENLKYYKDAKNYNIPDKQELPIEYLDEIGAPKGSYILPGDYPILKNDEDIMVVKYKMYLEK